MTYYMTSTRQCTTGYYDKCVSGTLSGAKREASQRYGDGFRDDLIVIAVGDNDKTERSIIAWKHNDGTSWFTDLGLVNYYKKRG